MCGFLPISVAAPASSADCSASQETVCLRPEEREEAFRPGRGQHPSLD